MAEGDTRRIRGALQPALTEASHSRSTMSRVAATLTEGLADTLARGPRRDLCLPRWVRPARAQCPTRWSACRRWASWASSLQS